VLSSAVLCEQSAIECYLVLSCANRVNTPLVIFGRLRDNNEYARGGDGWLMVLGCVGLLTRDGGR